MRTNQAIHFIGIGGIGMSGIARSYLAQGYRVQGTDIKSSDVTAGLERLGAKVYIGHDSAYISGADLVVYSSSIPEDHPERLAAIKNGVKIIHRADALAKLCRGKFTIAVTGTHGKTTTTALIGMILKEAGREPSVVVGGWVNSLGGNACVGQGKEIVIEADESDSSFLKFSPDIEVITNIEEEHLDHFKNIQNIEAAYKKFLSRLRKNGQWFGCSEDPRVVALSKLSRKSCALYGFDPSVNELSASDIMECPKGKRGVTFKVSQKNSVLGEIEMQIIGRHNVLNALAAIGVGLKLGIDFSSMRSALAKFEGAGRRFDVKYEDTQFLVVDDYAHHPTEIEKTLSAAKALHRKRIIALFQPHRYTRTQALLGQFGKSFGEADKLVVTDIYAAGESPQADVTGEKLCGVIRDSGHRDAVFIERGKLTEYIRSEIKSGDLVITLGAGDITQVAGQLAELLKNSKNGHHEKPAVFKAIKGKVLLNEPLSKHTTLKVGGPAKFWIEPENKEDLKKVFEICRENHLKIYLLGAGSNILAPDEELDGAVISLASPYFKEISLKEGKIAAGAGILNTAFIQFAMEKGFGGCEFLLGIPGCIGGTLAMNAGSHGQWIETLVDSITVLGFNGDESVFRKKEIPFKYRSSGIKDAVILGGVFKLPVRDREEVQKKLDEYRDYRQTTQDLRHPSAGCMFKNPESSSCSSGKLIEDSGLKGKRIGNAQVSLKHANFIINLGGASSKDIRLLIEEVQRTVKEKLNVQLETEVKIL